MTSAGQLSRLGYDRPDLIARRAVPVAACVGVVGGLLASLARSAGPEWLAGVAGGIAVWITVGFLVARATRNLRSALLVAVVYQASWLLLFYVTQRVVIDGATIRIVRDAIPWLVLLLPGACLIGLVAHGSLQGGPVGDACLTLPLAWSTQEALRELGRGPGFVVGAAITVVVGALPLVLERRNRRVHPVTGVAVFVVATVLIGLAAHVVQTAPITSV